MTDRLTPFWLVTWARWSMTRWEPNSAMALSHEYAERIARDLTRHADRYKNITITGPHYVRVPS